MTEQKSSEVEQNSSDVFTTSKLSELYEASQITCIICYSSDNENGPKMFCQSCTKCFHKSCYGRANMQKDIPICPYCRIFIPVHCENEYYHLSQIDELIGTIHSKRLTDVKKYMKESKIDDYVISGSFALYLYLLFHRKKPIWVPGDIDIYTKHNFSKYFGLAIQTKNFVTLKVANKTQNYLYTSNIVIENSKYNIYQKNERDDLRKIFTIDFVFVYTTCPSKIISSFDLDCCKIAMTISNDVIKFYIHNDFHVDSYIIKNNSETTIKRVKKYRERGFNCYNYEGYDEE